MSENAPARIFGDGGADAAKRDSLFSILQHAVLTSPQETALVHDGRSLRYQDLHAAAELLARALMEAGLGPGDKIGIMAADSAEYITEFFAVARLGAVAVPIPRASKADEVSALADQTELHGFCYSRRLASLIPTGAEAAIEVPALPDRGCLEIRRCPGRVMAQAEREIFSRASIGMIRFSSGTTGAAKGVMLSSHAILARAEKFYRAYSVSRDSCVLHLLSPELATPTFLGCLSQRAKMALADIHNLESIARSIHDHEITHIHATPLYYKMMVVDDAMNAGDLCGVTHVISTGAPLPVPVAKAFRDKFGREIFQYFALAECGTVFSSSSEDIEKRGSSGTPVPGCDAKLANATESDGGEIGDLLVRGSGLFEGYYRPWRLRDEVLEDGWFRTGDLARRDRDGHYWIIGRTKDVINVGGVKVFPDEIEAVLLGHPAVDQAVVFGASDPRFGEAPRAKVRLVPGTICTEKELIDFSNKKLSVFRRLRSVEVVTELPQTSTGKLLRND